MTDVKQKAKELKPCPFCGVSYNVSRNSISHPSYNVEKLGKRCAMDGIGWDNSESVIDTLNTRTPIVEAQEWNPIDTTPTKEKIVEAMAAAYYESSTGNKWAVCTRGREGRRMHMKIALQALLKELPRKNPKTGCFLSVKAQSDFYQELINMRGDDA